MKISPVISREVTNEVGFASMRFEPGKDNLFSMQDEEGHRKLRNKMAAGV